MKTFKTVSRVGWLLLGLSLSYSAVSAQRRRPAAPKPQATPLTVQSTPTFDTLLAADSYRIYLEVRGVGQLLRSPAGNDILDPVMNGAAPPKEFKALMKWLDSQADALTTSRMMLASWPSRPKLPQLFLVIEFPSPEEAQKFEPRLKEFLPKVLPSPTPETSRTPNGDKNVPRTQGLDPAPGETGPPGTRYIVKQSGALIFISDAPFTFKGLRPAGSKLLGEDHNFRRVHDRFASESVFLFVDVASLEREEQERRQKYEEEQRQRSEHDAANPPKPDTENGPPSEISPDMQPEEMAPPPPVASDSFEIIPQTGTDPQPVGSAGSIAGSSPAPDLVSDALGMLSSAFFGGRTTWPEAVGIAIAFESDSYSVRVLLLSGSEGKGKAIPFLPQLISGPAVAPESPSILPADTELLVALSLDYPLIYEGMLKAIGGPNEATQRPTRSAVREPERESPFAAYEKKLGLKIKDDLLPLLGNEVAISIPVKSLDFLPAQSARLPEPLPDGEAKQPSDMGPSQKSPPRPVVAISVKDKEGLRILIPKIIESIGFKGANLLAQTEKRDDTELVSYANAISYAFIGNFLLVSSDTKALRHVVDSYLNHQTLSSDGHFRNYTRWQPRQVLGQVYVSPALMESYSSFFGNMGSPISDQLGNFLSRLSPTAEPVTYALSNEGLGPLHELHVPRSLLLLMIAGLSSPANLTPLVSNEAVAKSSLRSIVSAEAAYQATEGEGNYGSLEQLVEKSLFSKDIIEKHGYKIEVTVAGTSFEARAVPIEYGTTGKMSFFVDESAVLRGGDHGGGPATVADKPVQ